MAQVQVVDKTGNINGETINWKVLSIVGYAGGEIQTLELKLSKTEAMLARILLNEEKPTTDTRHANADEIENHLEKVKRTPNNKTILDDDDEDEDGFLN